MLRGSRFFSGNSGGGGGPGPTARKQSGQHNFSPQLILQFTEGVKWVIYSENYTFPRIQRRSNIFQGRGSNFFQAGPIETHITCDFPAGSGPTVPPGSAHDRSRQGLLYFKGVKRRYYGVKG